MPKKCQAAADQSFFSYICQSLWSFITLEVAALALDVACWVFVCQLLSLISTLLDGVAKLFFLLISGIAKPHNLSWLVPSYHLIPERFEKSFGCR